VQGEVSAASIRKMAFPGVGCPPDAKPAPPGAAGKAVDQKRLKPCRGRRFRLYGELESETPNGSPGLLHARGAILVYRTGGLHQGLQRRLTDAR